MIHPFLLTLEKPLLLDPSPGVTSLPSPAIAVVRVINPDGLTAILALADLDFVALNGGSPLDVASS
jgi:hypothetical protein